MKKEEFNELTKLFSEQLKIVNDIYINLSCDLYVCFEGEKEAQKLAKKIIQIKKIKKQLIQTYANLIGEF